METVQMRCGNCNRLMAISVADLGSQVHCPHCQTIVETQASPKSQPEASQTEFFFPGPTSSQDNFHDEEGTEVLNSASLTPRTKTEPDLQTNSNDDLTKLQPRRVAKGSAWASILLIFLIPYSILATAAVVYLFSRLNQAKQFDPLERLPDPRPKDGGPRYQERVQHDAPLPDRLKTRLGGSLNIGALEVNPLKVEKANDELILHLKMKNVSKNLIFNPISKEFLKTGAGNLPYTYLEGGQPKIRVYGGFPEWLKGATGHAGLFGGEIGPGEEELVRIVTPKSKTDVNRILNSQEPLVWRVQVRRGFVDVGGNPVSATAVVGVEFQAKDIE
jgi:phage FluMu protein Com